MSYYFNKITDLIKNKVYVENGPLEVQPGNSHVTGINKIKKIPLLKESEKIIVEKIDETDGIENKFSEPTENINPVNINSLNMLNTSSNGTQSQNNDGNLRDMIKAEFNVQSYSTK